MGGVEDAKTHGNHKSMPRKSSDAVVPIGRRTQETPASATVRCSGSCVCSPSSSTSSGTISDGPGDYSNGESCYWVIASSGGSGGNNEIRLSFPSFETESYDDYVRIYSCSSSSSPTSCSSSRSIASLSGSSVSSSRVYTSSTGYMQVKFTSDISGTYSGFVGRWEVGCAAGSYASSGSASCRPCTASADYYCPVGSTSAAGIACEAGYRCPGGDSDRQEVLVLVVQPATASVNRDGFDSLLSIRIACGIFGGIVVITAIMMRLLATKQPPKCGWKHGQYTVL